MSLANYASGELFRRRTRTEYETINSERWTSIVMIDTGPTSWSDYLRSGDSSSEIAMRIFYLLNNDVTNHRNAGWMNQPMAQLLTFGDAAVTLETARHIMRSSPIKPFHMLGSASEFLAAATETLTTSSSTVVEAPVPFNLTSSEENLKEFFLLMTYSHAYRPSVKIESSPKSAGELISWYFAFLFYPSWSVSPREMCSFLSKFHKILLSRNLPFDFLLDAAGAQTTSSTDAQYPNVNTAHPFFSIILQPGRAPVLDPYGGYIARSLWNFSVVGGLNHVNDIGWEARINDPRLAGLSIAGNFPHRRNFQAFQRMLELLQLRATSIGRLEGQFKLAAPMAPFSSLIRTRPINRLEAGDRDAYSTMNRLPSKIRGSGIIGVLASLAPDESEDVHLDNSTVELAGSEANHIAFCQKAVYWAGLMCTVMFTILGANKTSTPLATSVPSLGSASAKLRRLLKFFTSRAGDFSLMPSDFPQLAQGGVRVVNPLDLSLHAQRFASTMLAGLNPIRRADLIYGILFTYNTGLLPSVRTITNDFFVLIRHQLRLASEVSATIVQVPQLTAMVNFIRQKRFEQDSIVNSGITESEISVMFADWLMTNPASPLVVAAIALGYPAGIFPWSSYVLNRISHAIGLSRRKIIDAVLRQSFSCLYLSGFYAQTIAADTLPEYLTLSATGSTDPLGAIPDDIPPSSELFEQSFPFQVSTSSISLEKGSRIAPVNLAGQTTSADAYLKAAPRFVATAVFPAAYPGLKLETLPLPNVLPAGYADGDNVHILQHKAESITLPFLSIPGRNGAAALVPGAVTCRINWPAFPVAFARAKLYQLTANTICGQGWSLPYQTTLGNSLYVPSASNVCSSQYVVGVNTSIQRLPPATAVILAGLETDYISECDFFSHEDTAPFTAITHNARVPQAMVDTYIATRNPWTHISVDNFGFSTYVPVERLVSVVHKEVEETDAKYDTAGASGVGAVDSTERTEEHQAVMVDEESDEEGEPPTRSEPPMPARPVFVPDPIREDDSDASTPDTPVPKAKKEKPKPKPKPKKKAPTKEKSESKTSKSKAKAKAKSSSKASSKSKKAPKKKPMPKESSEDASEGASKSE
jgi:hypothetical protein